MLCSLFLVRLAPNWFESLVESVSSDYGLKQKPIRSVLDELPE